jgi:hypothetical protein
MIAASPARAQEKGEACATAYEQAQQLLKEHSPLRARTELRLCLKACPTVLARDCTGWLAAVEPQIGSLRVSVEASTGAPAHAVLTVDDAPVTPEGDVIEVDPGEHRIVGRDAGGGVAEARVTVAAGQRDVPVRLRLPAPPPPIAPALPRRPLPPPDRTAPFVLGGVGLGAIAAGGVLGLVGELQRSHLASTCAPRCDPQKVDQIQSEWIAGGIAAGAGVIALATAVVFLASERRPSTSALRLTPPALTVAF